MITHYRVHNFKNIDDLGDQFNPEPLNVIVGANGSGKTSLLQSMDFLRAFFMSSVELYTQDKGWSLRDLPSVHRRGVSTYSWTEHGIRQIRATPVLITWKITCVLPADIHGNGAGMFDYSAALSAGPTVRIYSENLTYTPHNAEPFVLLDRNLQKATIWSNIPSGYVASSVLAPMSSVIGTFDPNTDRTRYAEMLRFREYIEGFRSFAVLDPKILRNPDRGKHLEVGPNGEHLASFLAVLRQKRPDDFSKLLARITRIFPYISDLTLTGGRGWGWREIQQHEAVNGTKGVLRGQQMSDGVLRLLAIASLLYAENTPSVVMVEEPEDGIHPQLLREVVGLLRELTQQKPPRRCQVFFTTHSPYVLDEFLDHEEEVFLMDRRPEGAGASVSQLSNLDAKQLAALKENFSSLGEQWYSGFIGGTSKGTAVGN